MISRQSHYTKRGFFFIYFYTSLLYSFQDIDYTSLKFKVYPYTSIYLFYRNYFLHFFTHSWEQCKLNELVRYYSSNLTSSDAQEDGLYDLYDANNLIGKTNLNAIMEKYITVIKDGAGVGRIRILPENTSFIGTMGALLPENSDIDFDFALLSRYSLSSGCSGSTIPHIYFKDYGNNEYFVPKIYEQIQIGKLFIQIDSLITLHQRE